MELNTVVSIYYGLIITGAIILSTLYGVYSLVGYMVGYSLIIVGILIMAGYLIKLGNYLSGIMSFLIISPIVYYVYMIGKYKDRIINGHISESYYTFSNILLFLTLLQNYILYKLLQKSDTSQQNGLTQNLPTILMLFLVGVLSSVTVLTVSIILNYFTTDG